MATRRQFTQEYKDQAVNLVLDSGRSIAEVAKSIGVHEMTLGKWVKKARENGQSSQQELSESERCPASVVEMPLSFELKVRAQGGELEGDREAALL